MNGRRRFIAGTGLALALAALPGLAHAKVLATGHGDREDLSLWSEQPAGRPWILRKCRRHIVVGLTNDPKTPCSSLQMLASQDYGYA
jgi:hypothetical protein